MQTKIESFVIPPNFICYQTGGFERIVVVDGGIILECNVRYTHKFPFFY